MGETIGVDLGGTNILAGVVRDGVVGDVVKVDTPSTGPDAVADAIAGAVRRLSDDVAGVGVGAPGPVDAGAVIGAPNLVGWDGRVPLRRLLVERLGLDRVVLVNDADAAVFGEFVGGAARGGRDVLGLWWGTGVGGGLVLDGRLRVGPGGSVGEIGHVPVDISPKARICGCSRVGCAEAYAGRASMQQAVLDAVAKGRRTNLLEIRDQKGKDKLTSGVWRKALRTGDPLAIEVIDRAFVALGAMVAGVVNSVDVDTIVLGGGMGEKLASIALERIAAQAEPRVMRPDVPRRWVVSELEDHAGVVGAAALSGL